MPRAKQKEVYNYKCQLVKVVDGDTIDVDIDLGFDVWLRNQRVRLHGIDTPESRTRNKAEKVLGLAAKEFLTQQCRNKFTIASMGRGKFGRILGIVYSETGIDICKLMIKTGHAVEYYGGKKNQGVGMSILGSLIEPATKLLDKVIEDKDQKAALAHEIATMAEKHAQELAKGQIEINKLDAKGNWFQSSWRPLAGYTCVLGLMVNFLVAPIAAGFGLVIPQADAGVMMPLLLGMLGLGGARSFERVKGVGK